MRDAFGVLRRAVRVRISSRVLAVVALLALPVVVVGGGCRGDASSGSGEDAGSRVEAVSVTAVEAVSWRWEGRREGVVGPALQQPLVAPAAGVVSALAPERDAESAVLLRLVDEESAVRIRGLRAQWSAESELLERYRGLREEGVLLEEEWQSVRRAHDALRAELDAAQARARQRTVRRPEGMVVVRWLVGEGAVVGEGETLGWLSERGSFLVTLRFSPVEIGSWAESALRVSCAAGAAAPGPARVLAPTDGTAGWTLEMPLADDHPCAVGGTRVRVEAAGPAQEGMWRVPPRGVAHDAEESWVLRVTEGGGIERVAVEVVRAVPDGLAVRGDLAAGDRVLREDPRPREGIERVEPVEVP